MKKLITILLTISMLLTLAACGESNSDNPPADDERRVGVGEWVDQNTDDDVIPPANDPTPVPTTAEVGAIIQLGGYDWRVLDVQDGRALLISELILFLSAYHNEEADVTWETCELRAYLNGEFYESFSADDRARIATVYNYNTYNKWYGWSGRAAVNITQDNIFLLSLEEVVKYFGDSGHWETRPGPMWGIDDEYNENRIAYSKAGEIVSRSTPYPGYAEEGESYEWWLRSCGSARTSAANVLDDGRLNVGGNIILSDRVGVRPAMWIYLGEIPSETTTAPPLLSPEDSAPPKSGTISIDKDAYVYGEKILVTLEGITWDALISQPFIVMCPAETPHDFGAIQSQSPYANYAVSGSPRTFELTAPPAGTYEIRLYSSQLVREEFSEDRLVMSVSFTTTGEPEPWPDARGPGGP